MRFADLHTHTTFSDGTTTPQDLIKLASDRGLSCVAISDHDTVDGLAFAEASAQTCGVELVPSLELSSEYENSEVHILGFFIEYKKPSLLAKLKEIRADRVLRMREMVERLNTMGVNVDINKVLKIAGNATVGRMHLARILHQDKFISTTQEAFYKYIGEDCPAYVSNFKLKPKDAIELVLSSGGVPVLAHPYVLNNDNLIAEFTGYGLLGLEVYYPEHSPDMTGRYERFAAKFNLIKTGGSDYHGALKPQNPLGKIKVPYSVVEELRNAKTKIK